MVSDWHSISSNHQIFTQLPKGECKRGLILTKQLVNFTSKNTDLNKKKQFRIHLLHSHLAICILIPVLATPWAIT
jgi:putative ABC transport system permease protein